MDINQEELELLLDEVYEFKDTLHTQGNSKYLRIAAKDVLFYLLCKQKKQDTLIEHNRADIAIMKGTVKYLCLTVPIILSVLGSISIFL